MVDKFKNIYTAILGRSKKQSPKASSGNYDYGFTWSYNGEKNLGEIGPIKNYKIDYDALRLRSWQSYLESEITQTILNKFKTWVIGSGLKLRSEPNDVVLKSEKINIDTEQFNEIVEARFNLYSKSRRSDFSEMKNIHKLADRAFLNAFVGGDCLLVMRYVNNTCVHQLIDGAHICNPKYASNMWNAAIAKGNRIVDGIEISSTGEHVAFYVKKGSFDVERVPAKGEQSGLTMASLIYGMEYRLDNKRGIPLISTVLETIKKLERYKEATVGSAEERQKIAFTINHQVFSDGENPLIDRLAKSFSVDGNTDEIPVDVQGNALADKVIATTNKQTFNMPKGAELKSLESKNELHFKDFYSVNINLICAALGIPPEVALSKYDSNFSASRAALKDWENTIYVVRDNFSSQFYQPIYDFWLEVEILKNKVQAPGYLQARKNDNWIVLDAYRNARFIGANVPHIDPLKEVQAERLKLGDTAGSIPLTTVEAATEALNSGESESNMKQYSDELNESKKLKILVEPQVKPLPNS